MDPKVVAGGALCLLGLFLLARERESIEALLKAKQRSTNLGATVVFVFFGLGLLTLGVMAILGTWDPCLYLNR